MVRRATDPDPAARPSMREMRAALESAVERRATGVAPGRLVAAAPPAAMVEDKTTRVPDPVSAPLAGAIGDAVGITGSRGVGRRKGDRNRARLLTAAAVAAVLLALALILSARQPGAEGVAAGATRPALPRAGALPASGSRARAAGPPVTVPADEGASEDEATEDARADGPGSDAGAEEPVPTPAPTVEPARPHAAAVSSTEEPDPPVERIEEPSAPDAAPAQLGGRWDVQHQVESTDYGPFAGLRLGYELTLFQEGRRVYGQGHKVAENGRALPQGQRTPIDVAGRIEDGEVVLHFTEIGSARTSRGTIRWRVQPEATGLAGRFTSDAANSSGSSRARRAP
jgi:hypothetical protein